MILFYFFMGLVLGNSISILFIWKALASHSKTDSNTLDIFREQINIDYTYKLNNESQIADLFLMVLSMNNRDGSCDDIIKETEIRKKNIQETLLKHVKSMEEKEEVN